MSIHLQTSRSNSLRSAFIDALDVLKYKNQRRHKLLILSCYIDFDAIERLIRSVREKLPLSEVLLAFEFMEAFRSRLPNETEARLERVRLQCKKQDIDFQWSPLRAGALMHAKGYAVIQVVNGDEAQGVVCIGSGNATLPGLGIAANGARANVELACISSDEEDVGGFRSAWDHLMGSSRSLEDASRREDDYAFSYALLASGIFLHDWQATLRSHVGISYMLTPEGRKAISVDEELRRLGFDVDTASMNRNPLRETVDFSSVRALPHCICQTIYGGYASWAVVPQDGLERRRRGCGKGRGIQGVLGEIPRRHTT